MDEPRSHQLRMPVDSLLAGVKKGLPSQREPLHSAASESTMAGYPPRSLEQSRIGLAVLLCQMSAGSQRLKMKRKVYTTVA